ncbi:MAG: A/G-specific adenine glycosylase [Gammaproteobacteria bacterium RIFCSPLOWO2_02_FULL_57_10]|nr:MAG: A/G-specific adenine glycosylase [Gammaproteobacteria bacterium RIFCSPLOWO2_02_FULL_57_10]
MNSPAFSRAVLDWFAHSGRHHLPWQEQPNPYRVWVSEIMLQQTQVSTVIPYFQKFMQHYPDVHALASAPIDEVLHLWTGLGYYARARNLHRSAGIVSRDLGGEFPRTVEGLCALPGIGRSTAGAILSLGAGIRAPILDGNVKRVLCRYHAIPGWPDQPAVQKKLWVIAEEATPEQDFAAYTQAMMDLGATVCTRSKPACTSCPLQKGCQALAQGATKEFPHRKPAKAIPTRTTHMLMCCTASGSVLLEKRPPSGIWGGLWSFPEFADKQQIEEFCQQWLGMQKLQLESWPLVKHTFSHFHLQITPVHIVTQAQTDGVMEAERWLWYPLDQTVPVGLAAPVKELLRRLQE